MKVLQAVALPLKLQKSGGASAMAYSATNHPVQEAVIVNIDPLLESTVRALNAMSPQNRELVALLVRQLAEREGITMSLDAVQGLQSPVEGIPLWVAKMKQESFSKRTIELYVLTVRSYLTRDPSPTKLSIQQWLADRMEQVSTAKASNDRKALRSLFSFLHGEGLWHIDPTAGLKHIRVRYRARALPEMEDIRKLMLFECYRSGDTFKFRTMVTLLATTGLRVTEGAGILKKNVDFTAHEIRMIGKGDKEGIVPMLPVTEEVIRAYIDTCPSDSPFLFPGATDEGFWSISSFEKTMRRACVKLGIEKVTPHQLRHLYATVLLKGGAKLEVVSKILRHASVAITADIYRHVLPTEIHETAGEFAPFNEPRLTAGGRRPE